MKVIGIVNNNFITGIEYGVIEIETPREKQHKHPEKKIKYNKKHESQKNTHLKVANQEKETKVAKKHPKAQYKMRATIILSYNYKPSQKRVDLIKKCHQKNQTLFKKKQRREKIALQNVMQAFGVIEPLFNYIQTIDPKTR